MKNFFNPLLSITFCISFCSFRLDAMERKEVPSLKEIAARATLKHTIDYQAADIPQELKHFVGAQGALIANNNNPQKALFEAARRGHAHLIYDLLAAGAHIDTYFIAPEPRLNEEHGMTPLMIAAREGHVETLRELVRCGANVNRPSATPRWYGGPSTPIMYAIRRRHLPAVQALVDLGADINQHVLQEDGTNGTTPLIAATGDVRIARFLLQHGANANAGYDDGHDHWVSPLFIAQRIISDAAPQHQLLFLLGAYGARD